MKKINLRNTPKVAALLIILFTISFNGCGDSNISGLNENESKLTAAGENSERNIYDSTVIRLDLSLKFKSASIAESKALESNIGNRFNSIIPISKDLKPNEELDLQVLQPYGIFGLYLSSTGRFSLTNSDGMSFTSKTVLMEKCSFIDLKLRNQEQTPIHVSGFVAGE
ncbi:MAG: hypothetical protein M3R36_10390 [Bacteroidota bacterium]|nr:hypothetical protein [Bacteroidota bacterium]